MYLLAEGRLCYGGSRDDIANHFGSLGLDMPLHVNPAEWILEMVDTDFAVDATVGKERLARLHAAWAANATSLEATQTDIVAYTNRGPPTLRQPLYLLHRSFIKSYRDLTAYWLRVGMYTGELAYVWCAPTDVRACYPHGYHLAPTGVYPSRHHPSNHKPFLRWRLPLVHGGSVYTGVH